MRQFFITLAAVVVGILLTLFLIFFILAGMVGVAMGSAASKDKASADGIVLTLDLRQSLRDHGDESLLFGGKSESVINIVRSLERAKTDATIKGLFIRGNSWSIPPAKAEELRLSLLDFRASDKFVIAHVQGFNGTSLSNYLAVSAADEIWQQDTTGFSLAGYRAEVGFWGGVFEKFDAKPEFIQFHEYKNAANTYTQSRLTEAHREAVTTLMQSIMDSAVNLIAADRGMTEIALLSALDNAPHSAEQARKLGFVDKLGHVEDVRAYIREETGEQVSFQSIGDYDTEYVVGPVIAFVGGEGPIVEGASFDGSNPFAVGGVRMGGDTVSEAILKAARDDSVRAIVLRIHSPGGSATASDQIWDAVNRAKKAGKPVVVSMGQYAASGGYYISANADKIVAMPTTITGSIGVLAGKIVISDTLAKIGYNSEPLNFGGEYGAVYSVVEPWNQATREAFRESMEDIYVDFTSRVAEGRNIPLERVLEIAKGRVWTGMQAKELGLVDELGGFSKAVEIAKKLAKIEADKKVRIKQFPKPLSTSEQLAQVFNITAETVSGLQDIQTLLKSPEIQALIKARTDMDTIHNARLKADLPTIK